MCTENVESGHLLNNRMGGLEVQSPSHNLASNYYFILCI